MLKLGLRVLLLIGASWLFATIAADVLKGGPPSGLDAAITHWFHAWATPWVTRGVLLFTNLHSTAGISIFALLLAFYLAWKRFGSWLLTLALAVPTGMLINALLKQVFMRARPDLGEPLLTLSTYSFPSGHVASATLFYGVLAAFLCSATRSWRRRALIVLAACVLVVLVGVTRLYLGVHHFSDVVGALAWSTAWLSVCFIAVDALGGRRKTRRRAGASPG